MKNIQSKAIQIGGYLRILAIAVAVILTLIFGSKAFAIAPHMPDMGLQAEVDHHRESVEKSKDQKAADKVSKYKEHKIKDKGHRDKIKEKTTGKKKDKPKKEKKAPKPKKEKKPKEKKPKKPSKSDKKRAHRHKARNLS